ncbi:ABC transporter permease [Sporomusa acidovorans]|uniref:Macrolide export ATP-binding/permease protein MacB n=1 Tax=Sporomusa acidovorans (strain ATCC 49682 / DSM 3132 / Mol) TaxID=1123286 RepID=A0ABZ3IXH4_SPOA4|nr:ABC transporter permease [Sporomusa acidovorans]OZC22383.1 macrolide export ATP-binding/permease protein MacB [Sporomusa acidovorans DSM 3132]SDE47561.1 putative ABC transport system permease protein [Sporomusa acidovorans]
MFWESVKIALDALVSNKLRSILTMLGIIIGVGAVIAMVSIGMGVREKVSNSIASLGSNLIIVMPGASSSSGVRQAAGTNITLTFKDAEAIEREVPGIGAVAPSVNKQYQMVAGNMNWTTSVQGTTPEYLTVRNLTVQAGSFITNDDLDSRNRVAVIGATVASNLFNSVNPVGQSIRINNAPFTIIGVLDSKGQSAGGQDQDDIVIIPLTTAQERMMGITYVQTISVQAANEDVVDQVQDGITALLRARHGIAGDKADDFTVRNLASVMATAQETTGTITMLLGSIAAISLLVGGIGIMNIMLVSVTERTREIGIRKALGARFSNILMQFLIEAVVIGVIGGAIGIALGIGGSYTISSIAGWNTVITATPILVSFGFSVGIGLFFGLYPARKAALLNPIDALRYE